RRRPGPAPAGVAGPAAISRRHAPRSLRTAPQIRRLRAVEKFASSMGEFRPHDHQVESRPGRGRPAPRAGRRHRAGRGSLRGKGGARLVSGDVVVGLSEGRATRAGRQLGLTGIEFRILAALMRTSGQLVTYAQLAEAVWAVTTGPESNSLEVHISRIRQKLEH